MTRLAPLLLLALWTASCNDPRVHQETAAADSPCAAAGETGVVVTDAWVRAAPSGQGATAAYFTLCNAGESATDLIGVDTQAADVIELHETTRDESGVASMAAITSAALPPKEPVSFAPGGKHVMLIGVKETLADGGSVDLTLHFSDGSQVDVQAPVRAAPEAAHDQH
jgi:copper(I)-binding protein